MSVFGVLRMAPWWRGPRLLFRRPGVGVGLVAAAFVGGTADVIPVSILPAGQGGYPVAVVVKDALGRDAQYAVPQLWVPGDPTQIIRAAQAAHLPVTRVQKAHDLYFDSRWEPMTYTFDYLTALSLLTGVVTVVGLLLYLESQTPAHRRAYIMLRRWDCRPEATPGRCSVNWRSHLSPDYIGAMWY